MMKTTAYCLLALLTAAAGCMTPPPRENAWTSALPAAGTQSPYSDATVAVVYTENTKNALEYLRRSTYGQFDADAVFAGIFSAFDKEFKRAVRIQKVEQGRAAGADVVIVVDYYAALATTKFTTHKMDVTAAVLTPDGAEIDRLVVHAESRTSWTAVSRPMGIGVEQGAKDLGAQFDAKLLASSKLQDYLKARSGAPSARPVASIPAPSLPASPSPTFSTSERPDDLAIIVGIESYSDIASKAPYAERDADVGWNEFGALRAVDGATTGPYRAPYDERSARRLVNVEFWQGMLMALPVYFLLDHYLIPWLVDERLRLRVRRGNGRR